MLCLYDFSICGLSARLLREIEKRETYSHTDSRIVPLKREIEILIVVVLCEQSILSGKVH